MKRAAGVLLHPTSLPSPFGIGDLGVSAYEWLDILAGSGQGVWQICPPGPTGFGDSPYQCLSSFAGNPLLISPVGLYEMGLLDKADLHSFPALPGDRVAFGAVISAKQALFEKAAARFVDTPEFYQFCEQNRSWLDDFALYMVCKDTRNGTPWVNWETALRLRFPATLRDVRAIERRRIRYHSFLQYVFHTQWHALKGYAHEKGIRILGDIPHFVAGDSADVWSEPDNFDLDDRGFPLRVAGVPPDYYSRVGQKWGAPVYRWDFLATCDYAWWIERIRHALTLFDIGRLVHFQGFQSVWTIPADAPTAESGFWTPGPGEHFFTLLRRALPDSPLIAGDLGGHDEHLAHLRHAAGLPGITLLQFAFDGDPKNPYLQYNISPDSVVYTGNHDTNTALGWFNGLSQEQQERVCAFLNCPVRDFRHSFIRAAYNTPARLCIVPLQDVLGLDENHRMNVPGRGAGNWQWRVTREMLDETCFAALAEYTQLYGR